MHSLKAPFKKGIIVGSLDFIFRIFALVIWLMTAKILFFFAWDAIFAEPVWSEKIWWLTYSCMTFVMVTVLAYTAVWDRE